MNQDQQVGPAAVVVLNIYTLVTKGVGSVPSGQSAPMADEDAEGV
jgi:hypothetical protein